MGGVTGVAQVLAQGLVDEGGVADFEADVLQSAAPGAYIHVVAGQAGLAQIPAQVEAILARPMGVMAGATLRPGIEMAVLEGAVGGPLEVLFMTFRATQQELLVEQEVANGGLVGGVTFRAIATSRRMEGAVVGGFTLSVTGEAQLLRRSDQ